MVLIWVDSDSNFEETNLLRAIFVYISLLCMNQRIAVNIIIHRLQDNRKITKTNEWSLLQWNWF